MRICIAPDKYKGCLDAFAVAKAIGEGMKRALPDASFDLVPVADGGDGTAETLVRSLGGRMVERAVTGPDGNPVRASYGLLDSGQAVIELAAASGLALVKGRNDPLRATTKGTGQLIADALDAGARHIILGIGGSATNDAGSGALAALGAVFEDADRKALPAGGAALARLANIDTSALERRLEGVQIEIASDVRNPLCGPAGASSVFGPQKGASPADVRTLDAALANFADVAAKVAGKDVRDVPGAGAAGGVGAGFLALAHAVLRPGAALILELLRFDEHLAQASLVITGEGRLDRQTLSGKAPFAVAQAAKSRGIPTAAIAGSIDCSPQELDEAGIAAALSTVPGPMTLVEAMQRAPQLIANAAETLGRAINLGPKLT